MIAARCLPEPFFKHGDEGGGGIVAQRLSRLLHRLPADQQLQREDQLQLMAPAAKAQPRFAHYQAGQIPLAHRKHRRPLAQGLPARRILGHHRHHLTNFRVV